MSVEVKAIVTAGMGHYRALRWGLDILVANDQLELLLSRRSASRSSTGVWAARLGCHPHCCPGQGLRQCKTCRVFHVWREHLTKGPICNPSLRCPNIQARQDTGIHHTLLCLTAWYPLVLQGRACGGRQ